MVERSVGWKETLSDGREVGAAYVPESRRIVLYFSRRLTPEIMGNYKSIDELNRGERTNFRLSENGKSLISEVTLSLEAALALQGTLRRTISDYVPR